MRLLIVDDEELIRNVIREYCLAEGYTCDEAANGDEAAIKVYEHAYDLIIMDIMMPKMDGYAAVREIKAYKNIPVIMLSARSEEIDKLAGFELGIDDYVTKPFSPKELIARIKAVARRSGEEDILSYAGITVNKLTREVSLDDKVIELTHTQFELLYLFLNNPNIALSREAIIKHLWGYDYEADDRTVDAHIKFLRSKLGKYRGMIKTVRKVGYKFAPKT